MTTLIKNSAFARTQCWSCPLSASVHRLQNNPAVTQLHVLTNGDLLPHQIQRKPTNRGRGIPRTRGHEGDMARTQDSRGRGATGKMLLSPDLLS